MSLRRWSLPPLRLVKPMAQTISSDPNSSLELILDQVVVTSENLHQSVFSGPGAGRYPTANSVLSDVLRIYQHQVYLSLFLLPPSLCLSFSSLLPSLSLSVSLCVSLSTTKISLLDDQCSKPFPKESIRTFSSDYDARSLSYPSLSSLCYTLFRFFLRITPSSRVLDDMEALMR
jgi:hypothetical protein